jgi:hypothetical protein
MKWVTRTNVRLDRVAMIWLIKRVIDPKAEIVLLPESEAEEYATENGAVLFHHPKAEMRNTGFRTGFDAMILKYELTDPALVLMQMALRGAETTDRTLTPWSTGVRAIGLGLRSLYEDDERFIEEMGRVFDGLYQFCQDQLAPVDPKAARD